LTAPAPHLRSIMRDCNRVVTRFPPPSTAATVSRAALRKASLLPQLQASMKKGPPAGGTAGKNPEEDALAAVRFE